MQDFMQECGPNTDSFRFQLSIYYTVSSATNKRIAKIKWCSFSDWQCR